MKKFDCEFQVMLSVSHEWVKGVVILPIYAEDETLARHVAEHVRKSMGFDSVKVNIDG